MAPALYAIVGGVMIFFCLWLAGELRQQTKELQKLTNEHQTRQFEGDRSPRPYFTHIDSVVRKDEQGTGMLMLATVNNDVPVRGVVSQILVLDESLDPTKEPVRTKRVEGANPVGPHGMLTHYVPVPVEPDTPHLFIAFHMRYIDALSNKPYSQAFFLEWTGVRPDGNFIPHPFGTSKQKKTRIEQYIKDRRIPMLE